MTTDSTLRRVAAVIVMMCAAVTASACATRGTRIASAPPSERDAARNATVLAEYVRTLPAGMVVRVDRLGGRSMRGTLMKTTDQLIVVQPRTRVPEPAVEIPFSEVVRVTPESSTGASLGKAIGVGAAAGAAAALGVFFVIVAIFAD